MTKVHEAELVDVPLDDIDEAGQTPTPTSDVTVLVNTCSACGKTSRFALGVFMGRPYCGLCILQLGRGFKNLFGELLDAIRKNK